VGCVVYFFPNIEFEVLANLSCGILAFEALVDLLTPFLRPIVVTFVRPPVPVRKQASKTCLVPIGSWYKLC
jgi:hypothetical protein